MIEVYDIETLRPMYSYVGLNINSKQLSKFIICKYQNDLIPLITHLKQVKRQIGFNNLAFDAQVNEYILLNWKSWTELTGEEICLIIYKYAQYSINKTNNGGWPDYTEWKLSIKQLDLFKVWHFDNKAKMTSLKWIEYSIDFPNIKEMSIDHWIEDITWEQVQDVLAYNENDVMATYEFYLITIGQTEHPLYKGIDKIQLRKDIKEEFKINCINYNDVKIGDNINKTIYCKLSGLDKKELSKTGTFRDVIKVKDCIKIPIQFESEQLKSFYNRFMEIEFNPLKLKDSKEKGTKFNFMGLDITFGFGGIHSIDKPRIICTTSEFYLTDKDCTGMYPRTIIEQKLYPEHLGENWYKGCEYIYNKRAHEYKPLAKKDKKAQSFSEAFKLASNGGSFGKSNESTSWQYDPMVAFSITIFNQFALLRFAEMLLINNIKVLSLNTDGCVSYVGINQKDLYESICLKWEKLSGHTLEETLYSKLIQTSVNDYIAIKTDGELKPKGDFVTDFELHKNKSAKIIPIALQEYFSKGIEPEETIMNHNNIFDFCLGVKSKGSNKLVHLNSKTGEEIKLQKVNRYYISTNGNNLLKRLTPLSNKSISNQLDIFGNVDDGTREQEVEANWLSTIYNKHENKQMNEYQIDYSFYLKKVKKIINNIK